MNCIIIGEQEPNNSLLDIYYEIFKSQKDYKLRRILDNKENILRINNAMQKVWERKKLDEEEVMENMQI